jgi:uncharacterized protein YaeQ
MSMSAERREYRLAFTHVDRGFTLERALVLSRHPSESLSHLTLRVLAFLLLWEEGLSFGPGVCVGEAPDLVVHDLTGVVRTWIACGDVDPRLLRKVVQHNRDAAAHVVFGARARRDAFTDEVDSWGGRRPKGWERIALWTIDEALITQLADHASLRQRWTVTLAGDRFYVDVDGTLPEGDVARG